MVAIQPRQPVITRSGMGAEERPMSDVFEGIRILEVANWTFVPQAGAVFADLGADVVKIEHPVRGDPQRGLVSSGLSPQATRQVNYATEQTNHGKRSVGLDISTEAGREILLRLAEQSDVFLTNFLPAARRKLGIDVTDVRARNAQIIYVRGSGHGARGPDIDRPGYDATAFWARGGVAWVHSTDDGDAPVAQRGAFGDRAGAMNLAFGIASALFRRERTGHASVVDVSLLATAMWMLSSDLVASAITEQNPDRGRNRRSAHNPIANSYKTKDARWISLVMLESDRFWPDLCDHIDRPDLAKDDRFADADRRAKNADQCIAELDATFATQTLDEWHRRLKTLKGAWAPQQAPLEVLADPQVQANEYVSKLIADDGLPFSLVTPPVQIDEPTRVVRRAPEFAQHTEEVLLEIGVTWEEISRLKESLIIS
jgi:crotonobetainyl-CoA:carnitine CoA-transferase CaiB-like acyl-CoA transferase